MDLWARGWGLRGWGRGLGVEWEGVGMGGGGVRGYDGVKMERL